VLEDRAIETYGGVEVTCNFMYCYILNCRGLRIYKKKKGGSFHFELSSKFGVVKWLGEGSGVWVFFTSKFRTVLRVTQALSTARAGSWPMTASWSGCRFLFLHSTGQQVFTVLYHSYSTFTQFLVWYLQYSLLLQGLAPSLHLCDFSVVSFFGCSAFLLQTRWHTCCYSYCTLCSVRSYSYCTRSWFTSYSYCTRFSIPSYSYCTRLLYTKLQLLHSEYCTKLQLLHSVVVYEVTAIALGRGIQVTVLALGCCIRSYSCCIRSTVRSYNCWTVIGLVVCHVLLLLCHGYLHSEHCFAFPEEFAEDPLQCSSGTLARQWKMTCLTLRYSYVAFCASSGEHKNWFHECQSGRG
jgi:hypothetical protein